MVVPKAQDPRRMREREKQEHRIRVRESNVMDVPSSQGLKVPESWQDGFIREKYLLCRQEESQLV